MDVKTNVVYSRQISIAQMGIDTVKKFNLNQNDTRIKEVFELGGSVKAYTDSYDVKKKGG